MLVFIHNTPALGKGPERRYGVQIQGDVRGAPADIVWDGLRVLLNVEEEEVACEGGSHQGEAGEVI